MARKLRSVNVGGVISESNFDKLIEKQHKRKVRSETMMKSTDELVNEILGGNSDVNN